jgi:hypothetical protein
MHYDGELLSQYTKLVWDVHRAASYFEQAARASRRTGSLRNRSIFPAPIYSLRPKKKNKPGFRVQRLTVRLI